MWLVPPVSSSTSVLYQEPFVDVAVKPAFRNQDPVWKGRPLSGRGS
jgi:nitric oxide synthase oxygenase domain/subunit